MDPIVQPKMYLHKSGAPPNGGQPRTPTVAHGNVGSALVTKVQTVASIQRQKERGVLECRAIGRMIQSMKLALKKENVKYHNCDLAWWKRETKHILHPSIFKFDDAKGFIEKLRRICQMGDAERLRRTRVFKVVDGKAFEKDHSAAAKEARKKGNKSYLRPGNEEEKKKAIEFEFVNGKKVIKRIDHQAQFYFGNETNPTDDEYENIGRMIQSMKTFLKKENGKYLKCDLAWWKRETKHILHSSIFNFDDDYAAKELVGKLRTICEMGDAERFRRMRVFKKVVGKSFEKDNSPEAKKASAKGKKSYFRPGTAEETKKAIKVTDGVIKHIDNKAQFYFGNETNPKDGDYDKNWVDAYVNETTFEKKKNGKYLKCDLAWWKRETKHILHSSIFNF